ncbi:S-glutathionyl-(chloro)hydroquinone reductase [Elasticomyces elasticus]|nr:S-glutathionyl-(chloro)hydroquinone reductase [Elasticomyces elasticus]
MGFVLTTRIDRLVITDEFLAHRALIVRKLKGLEEFLPFTSVHWHMLEKGWRFATEDGEAPGENVTPDPVHPDFTHLRQIYFENNKDYGGRFTVPTLYDKKQKRIVNNESSEIIRMFYHCFDKLLPEKYAKLDLMPDDLKDSIEATNEWTYNDINNGVYKSGFATTQEAYEKNVKTLFAALDKAEAELAKSPGPYYHGDRVTEADVRLFTTIIRFDAVYGKKADRWNPWMRAISRPPSGFEFLRAAAIGLSSLLEWLEQRCLAAREAFLALRHPLTLAPIAFSAALQVQPPRHPQRVPEPAQVGATLLLEEPGVRRDDRVHA